MLLNILNYLYLCVWATLLIHCLHSKRLYPIFTNGLATRIFWMFTFIFFNPVLSFLYIFCALCPVIKEWKNKRSEKSISLLIEEKIQKRNMAITAFVITITCVIITMFEIPRKEKEIMPVVALNNSSVSTAAQNHLFQSGLNVGLIDAKNKIQTISSKSSKDNVVSLGNIVLICKSSHRFLEMISKNIQNSLLQLPYVNSVACYSSCDIDNSDTESADVFIALEMPMMNESKFLLNRDLKIKINCTASSSISDILYTSDEKAASDSIVSFTIKSQLQHSSRTFSIECPGTEYKHEVKNISHELSDAFKNQFEILMNHRDEISEVACKD